MKKFYIPEEVYSKFHEFFFTQPFPPSYSTLFRITFALLYNADKPINFLEQALCTLVTLRPTRLNMPSSNNVCRPTSLRMEARTSSQIHPPPLPIRDPVAVGRTNGAFRFQGNWPTLPPESLDESGQEGSVGVRTWVTGEMCCWPCQD